MFARDELNQPIHKKRALYGQTRRPHVWINDRKRLREDRWKLSDFAYPNLTCRLRTGP